MKKLNEKESNKIKPTPEEMELEAILQEIEADEELRNVTVPESVTTKLYAQIAAYDAAIAEIPTPEEQSLEERFPNMTEEERTIFLEALEAKKKDSTNEEKTETVQTEETDKVIKMRRRKRRKKKVYFAVAAVAILSMAMGTVGLGERYKWLQLDEKEMGSDDGTTIDSEDDMMLTKATSEKEAYDYAKEVLGMEVVPIIDLSNVLEFDKIVSENGSRVVDIFYVNKDHVIQYRMVQNGYKISHHEVMTGSLLETYTMDKDDVLITVQKYEEKNGEITFNVNYTYNNIYYTLKGMLEEEVLLELLDELFFL